MLSKFRQRCVRVVLQAEAAECGLACVAMVAAYHGHDAELSVLRRRFVPSQKGSTLLQLMKWGRQLGLTSRPLRAPLDQLGQLELPVVLHWNFDHFVVLEAITPQGGARIVDPARGRRHVSARELSDCYTGVALELRKGPELVAGRWRETLSIKRLLSAGRELRGSALQVIGSALLLEVIAAWLPLFAKEAIDRAGLGFSASAITILGLGFSMLVLLQAGLTLLRSWALTQLSQRASFQMMTHLFSHLLRLPIQFFYKRHAGDLLSRFDSLSAIQRTLTGSFLEGCLDSVMLVATLALMLYCAPPLGTLVFVAGSIYAAVRLWLQPRLREATEAQIARLAKQQSHLLETVRGIQSVKLFGMESQRQGAWSNLLVDSLNSGLKVQRLALAHSTVSLAVFGLENVLVVGLGAVAVAHAELTVGTLFAFLGYKTQFATRLRGFIDKLMELKMLALHRDRVADIALAPPESQDTDPKQDVEALGADIEVRDLSFSYSDGEPAVLEGVNFKVNAGESVAIVGPTGSGKTTMLKMMMGLLSPTSGEILVGGVRIDQIPVDEFRRHVAAVMQEDQLLTGTIADNIACFEPEVEMSRVRYAAALAGIHTEILSMPMAYQTLVGDMGTSLSGGQKQRLLLARALYREPKVLFLDEATSHLDVATERAVSDAIRRIQLTRIIIAHRPETIAMAGRVIDVASFSKQADRKAA